MVQPISPRAAQQLLQHADLDVVDVREPNEWSTGHLPGARLVPLANLRRSPKSVLPRDGVLFVCAAGVRSETAARLALQHGFSNVYSLTGGTRGWSREGLPLVRD
jgi:adenylyltransferase/sulfurtransferase